MRPPALRIVPSHNRFFAPHCSSLQAPLRLSKDKARAPPSPATRLFVSRISNSPFPFPRSLPQPEPSEGHPFAFIDFGTLGPEEIPTPLLSIICALFAGKNTPRGMASTLSVRHRLFTRSLQNKSCICHCYAKWAGYTQTSVSIQFPFWPELYFPLAPVRDSPLVAQALACALRLHNSQEPPQ